MAKNNLKIYSVARITAAIAAAIEEKLPGRLIVAGQISDFKMHSSGHCYFSLKDQNGILPAVMWAGKFKLLKFRPENGMAALVTGCVEVYAQGGKYQLYAEKIEPAGVGALQMAFEQLKAKLLAEGLFDEGRKRPLPPYPMSIGIITSASGAAVQDVADSIFRRWPCARLYLFDVPVQGQGAAEKIAAAIRRANRTRKKLALDLLIVGRGGGSTEDLWAFNEEATARAIAASALPVISAVGHETDFTIADFVADRRASTPTQAGMIAVPNQTDALERLAAAAQRLRQGAMGELRHCRTLLEKTLAGAVFKEPLRLLFLPGRMLDESFFKMNESMRNRLILSDRRLREKERWIRQIEPVRMIYAGAERLADSRNRLANSMRTVFNRNQLQLTAAGNKLHAMNPKAVLSRGYSITSNRRTGKILTSAGQVQTGDLISTELAGREIIESTVERTVERTPVKEQET